MRKNSIKMIKINNEVMRALSRIIHTEIKDPRIAPMTSVVAAEVSPDLKVCKAYISVLGDEKSQQDTIKGLRSAEGYIRTLLAKSVNLRNTPEITFISDQSIEYGVNMSRLIDEVNASAGTGNPENADAGNGNSENRDAENGLAEGSEGVSGSGGESEEN